VWEPWLFPIFLLVKNLTLSSSIGELKICSRVCLLVSYLNWSLGYAYRGIERLQTLARPALRMVAGGCGIWYVVRNSCCAMWIEFLKTLYGIVLLRVRGLRTKTFGLARVVARKNSWICYRCVQLQEIRMLLRQQLAE